MAGDPMEEVAKRMQGLKDSRSTIGIMARGKNMYPAGNNAQSGPGGPDMGRPPTAVPPQAAQAVSDLTQASHVGPSGLPAQAQAGQQAMPQQMNPNLQRLQNKVAPAIPVPKPMAPGQGKKFGNIAKAALQAAAQRKLQRGR